MVRDIHSEVAFIAEDPPRPGERVLAEVPRCLDLTECVQVTDEFFGDVYCPHMVLAEDSSRPGKANLAQLSRRLDLTEHI